MNTLCFRKCFIISLSIQWNLKKIAVILGWNCLLQFYSLNLLYNTSKFYKNANVSPRKTCPYSELFWAAFSRIRIEYGEIQSISRYSVQMRENADQNNSEYGHFPHSFCLTCFSNATKLLSWTSKHFQNLCICYYTSRTRFRVNLHSMVDIALVDTLYIYTL